MVSHSTPYIVGLGITWEFGGVFSVFVFHTLRIIDIFELTYIIKIRFPISFCRK